MCKITYTHILYHKICGLSIRIFIVFEKNSQKQPMILVQKYPQQIKNLPDSSTSPVGIWKTTSAKMLGMSVPIEKFGEYAKIPFSRTNTPYPY